MYRKQILKDCTKAMWPSTCIYILQETLFAILSVYGATQLGVFLNGVIELDFSAVVDNVWKLLGCVVIGVVVIPFMDFLGETVMLYNALAHDRIILGRFLEKTIPSAMGIEESEVQYRMENDPIELRDYWQEIIVKSVVAIAAVSYLLYNALPCSVIYTAIVFLISLLKLIMPVLIRNIKAKYDFKNREYKTAVRVYESLLTKNTWAAKMYNFFPKVICRLQQAFQDNFEQVQRKKISFEEITGGLEEFIGRLSYVVIVFAGAVLAGMGSIQAGAIAAMIGYLSVFDLIMECGKTVAEGCPLIGNLVERLDLLYDKKEKTSGEKLETPVMEIKAKNLGYSFDQSERKIEYPDFTLQNSDHICICGKNGSGKSTLLKILIGCYTDYTGSLIVNGTEVKDLCVDSLRSSLAYLEQKAWLFAGSVRDNIRLGNLHAEDEQLYKAAELAGVTHLLDVQVEYEKEHLSGGEIQRVALARVLLKNAQILLLDEPEHHLDSNGKKRLKEIIDHWNGLVVVVSHDDLFSDNGGKKISLSTYTNVT